MIFEDWLEKYSPNDASNNNIVEDAWDAALYSLLDKCTKDGVRDIDSIASFVENLKTNE